jgi:hypothetical protein
MIIAPSFDQAERQFAAFVRSQGDDRKVNWVLREDVVEFYRSFVVKRPSPGDTIALVGTFYEQAREARLGVVLQVLCRAREEVCAFVWAPRTVQDAEQALVPPAGLKLVLPTPVPRAWVVRSEAFWRIARGTARAISSQSRVQAIPARDDCTWDPRCA